MTATVGGLEPIYGWGAVPAEAIPPVLLYGDARLREIAVDVDGKAFSNDPHSTLQKGLRFMAAALALHGGAAIAAPQIGISQRVIVIAGETSSDAADGSPFALINPIIDARSSETVIAIEGCLSFPKVVVHVERPTWVQIHAMTPRGVPIAITAHGFFARVVCHEVEHLDGTLLVDHAGPLKRQMINAKMTKLRRRLRRAAEPRRV